jgi:hypothetical protein
MVEGGSVKIYVHKMTVRYLDYGELLRVENGIAWSGSGDPSLSYGFEAGITVEDIRKRIDIGAHPIEIVEGPPISRSFDMNPHGFI